ncbi:MAG: HPr-rel-A system PqqD family peptide chaperone [Gammaproteobacteria bacterium]|nr:HPr-rel-A system PqqD family peptide chaperone [Gammaproteobacteria bacterium]MBU2435865.1 HPr-rel-A system PqqD family peptide chaperone [Gammaproteobacteria bacterium]MBU2449354.1 HPr-rel-A system PqqD family peptide chaperone [Gammaproteobacteria bacterium]
MSNSDSQLIWTSADGQHFCRHAFLEESVLYNQVTGDTHLLDAFLIQVLALIELQPLSLDGLIRELGNIYVFAPSDDVDSLATSALHELKRVGLIVHLTA